jgi:hypothetical protein
MVEVRTWRDPSLSVFAGSGICPTRILPGTRCTLMISDKCEDLPQNRFAATQCHYRMKSGPKGSENALGSLVS